MVYLEGIFFFNMNARGIIFLLLFIGTIPIHATNVSANMNELYGKDQQKTFDLPGGGTATRFNNINSRDVSTGVVEQNGSTYSYIQTIDAAGHETYKFVNSKDSNDSFEVHCKYQ